MSTMSSGHKGREGGNNYYLGGGRGGSGGKSRNGAGGAGGQGMGASLSVDAEARYLNMSTHLHIDNCNNDNRLGTAGDSRSNLVAAPYVQQNIRHQGDRGIYILHRAVALAAMHDSAESFPQPKCHPETRTQMLDNFRQWALAANPGPTILWLYGPAGAGKSAIMQTLARQLQAAGRLGGCFFFKRGHATRGNARTLFATIAYQLTLSVSWLRTPIFDTVEDDPSILARSIDTQMQKLISEPCSPHKNHVPLAIIIDGLDECDGHDVQQELLGVIRHAFTNNTIPFRFFVASRPEPHIRDVFESPFYSGHYHSVNVEQLFHDVRKYLSDEFARIHREHDKMTRVPPPWPSENVLANLLWKSSGHFIYASTIIKFIDDKNYRPTQRLAVIQDANGTDSKSAFDPLDQLYMTILSSSPSNPMQKISSVPRDLIKLWEDYECMASLEGTVRFCLLTERNFP
ncbi:hypothetical protein C8R45DRAFT_568949 [Mycena sanguinolenta]|nr:hypothetical protein C8R45DRAFT_568949 [Mycena sanguinolenta]